MPCPTGKTQHSYEQASQRAKRARRYYEQPMLPYRCTACGAWHVGSTTHMPQPMRWINNNHELRCV